MRLKKRICSKALILSTAVSLISSISLLVTIVDGGLDKALGVSTSSLSSSSSSSMLLVLLLLLLLTLLSSSPPNTPQACPMMIVSDRVGSVFDEHGK